MTIVNTLLDNFKSELLPSKFLIIFLMKWALDAQMGIDFKTNSWWTNVIEVNNSFRRTIWNSWWFVGMWTPIIINWKRNCWTVKWTHVDSYLRQTFLKFRLFVSCHKNSHLSARFTILLNQILCFALSTDQTITRVC